MHGLVNKISAEECFCMFENSIFFVSSRTFLLAYHHISELCSNSWFICPSTFQPDSLGLDLDVPAIKYQGSELGFSDSFNSLTRMMPTSSDAFRNSTFLGASDN